MNLNNVMESVLINGNIPGRILINVTKSQFSNLCQFFSPSYVIVGGGEDKDLVVAAEQLFRMCELH